MTTILNSISITKKVAILIAILVVEFIFFILYSVNNDENLNRFYVSIIISSIISSFLLMLNVLRSIKDLIINLNNKTTELKELNIHLQNKIKEEVEKNRKKDRIMYQHSRLIAMGEMVGNIAHQWRQPLNAMTVLIQSFAIKNMTGKLTDEFIEKQVEEGLRLSKIMSNTIDNFRNFFAPNKSREYFYLKESIEDTIELIQEKDINITIKCEKDIKVYGYQNEFSQVILNLLRNAIDSFNKNSKSIYNKNILIDVKLNKNKDNVNILFIDNGGGIDEAIIDRIFEPYFTTKHKSTGTGIGLYMSKQIIEKQMKGKLEVENITMNFDHDSFICAKFEISLPIVKNIVDIQEEKLFIA